VADDQFLSFEDALDKLRLQEEELKRLVSEGEIRAFREGDTMKLRAQDVETLRSTIMEDNVDAGASEEIVFEDDVDIADEAGMATEEIADVETILQEDVEELEEVEEIELDEEEAKPLTDTAVRKRSSRAAAPTSDEEETEPGWVKGFLVVTSLIMILGIPVVMAVAKDQISSLARAIAEPLDFDKAMPEISDR